MIGSGLKAGGRAAARPGTQGDRRIPAGGRPRGLPVASADEGPGRLNHGSLRRLKRQPQPQWRTWPLSGVSSVLKKLP